ncbi:lactate utilization protein C [Mycobacterium sp. pV006]|uniref:lactate utilization protein C n=1 Tax=Mycobacterium sp. pV006 TaxID=3238983 RepID=UPI00351B18BC
MSEARAHILGKVRAALSDRPAAPEVPWTYGRDVGTGELGLIERFIERVSDYRATVDRVRDHRVGAAIAAALQGATSVVADETVRTNWPDSAPWVVDEELTPQRLDEIDAVVTTATVAVANTGTVVLTHGAGQGRRALSLVPDLHVCVVRADQIVDDIPKAVAALTASGLHTRPLTWISGPSATSDIELDRVEGVHGPRTLRVILAD